MATPEEVEYIRDAVAPLCEPLHEALYRGVETGRSFLAEHDLTAAAYNPLLAHIARAGARRHLEVHEDLLEGWLVGPSANNVQLRVARRSMSVRVLRALPFNAVPPPGSNYARVRYYLNGRASLFGVEDSDLIATWWIDGADEVQIRVVRPCGRWNYGDSSEVDVDFVLPQSIDTLADLAFEPDDEDLSFDFPAEDEEDEGDAGSLGR